MPSVLATESEVCGSCVGEIDVSVEVKNEDGWLCCGWSCFRFNWAVKAAQNRRCKLVMVPGIGCSFGLFEGD